MTFREMLDHSHLMGARVESLVGDNVGRTGKIIAVWATERRLMCLVLDEGTGEMFQKDVSYCKLVGYNTPYRG